MKCLYRLRYVAWALMAGFFIICGCQSASPPVAFYTMDAMPPPLAGVPSGDMRQDMLIGVGPLTIPRAIDRPQVVTRVSANRIHVAEFHRWAGAIEEEILRVLADNISLLLDTHRVAAYPWGRHFKPDYQVFVDIHQFDGTMGRKVLLRANWTITGTAAAKVLASRRSLIQEKVSGADYEALVAAKSRAVLSLSRDLAREIEKLEAEK